LIPPLRSVLPVPLFDRKRRLMRILLTVESRVLYLDHVAERGTDLFRAACDRDLEGIVAKWARGTYETDGRRTWWIKIKNPTYSQMEGRHELFTSGSPKGARRRQGRAARPELRLA
jgi:ATP-dependent DNA ligase